MKQKLEKLLSLFAPTFTLLISSLLLSLVNPISKITIVWIALIAVLLISLQLFVLKKKPEKATELGTILILISAICAIYLIAPLKREEMIFGAIMFSFLGILFIYYLISIFFKK